MVFGVWLNAGACAPNTHPVALPPLVNYLTLYLYIFRREPAISTFDWHITPNHRSSEAFAAATGSGLQPMFVDFHPAHG